MKTRFGDLFVLFIFLLLVAPTYERQFVDGFELMIRHVWKPFGGAVIVAEVLSLSSGLRLEIPVNGASIISLLSTSMIGSAVMGWLAFGPSETGHSTAMPSSTPTRWRNKLRDWVVGLGRRMYDGFFVGVAAGGMVGLVLGLAWKNMALIYFLPLWGIAGGVVIGGFWGASRMMTRIFGGIAIGAILGLSMSGGGWEERAFPWILGGAVFGLTVAILWEAPREAQLLFFALSGGACIGILLAIAVSPTPIGFVVGPMTGALIGLLVWYIGWTKVTDN